MTKPKLPLREQITKKSRQAREREDNFRKKFGAAPKLVQDECLRCEAEIKKSLDERPPKKFSQGFEKTIYAPQSGSLSEAQIVQLQELLCLQGWEVVQTAPLDWRGKGKVPRPMGLQFRYNGGPSKT
jgi:hypothetical protein